MVTPVSFSYDVGFPDDEWIPMPLPEEDVAAWAEDMVTAWEVPAELREAYLGELATHAHRFRALDRAAGAVWVPDLQAGIVATWTLDFGHWFEQSTVSVDEVERVARQRERPSGLADPVIAQVTLPAGPAVRIREYDAAPDEPGTVLAEQVVHVVVPDGVHDDQGRQVVFWQTVTWTEVLHGDEIAEVADKCAELLVVSSD